MFFFGGGDRLILQYLNDKVCKLQAKWRAKNQPPPDWPREGKVEFDNYGTRYRPGLDLVLKNINGTIYPREKVGKANGLK